MTRKTFLKCFGAAGVAAVVPLPPPAAVPILPPSTPAFRLVAFRLVTTGPDAGQWIKVVDEPPVKIPPGLIERKIAYHWTRC